MREVVVLKRLTQETEAGGQREKMREREDCKSTYYNTNSYLYGKSISHFCYFAFILDYNLSKDHVLHHNGVKITRKQINDKI